jgi:hypothetical protein
MLLLQPSAGQGGARLGGAVDERGAALGAGGAGGNQLVHAPLHARGKPHLSFLVLLLHLAGAVEEALEGVHNGGLSGGVDDAGNLVIHRHAVLKGNCLGRQVGGQRRGRCARGASSVGDGGLHQRQAVLVNLRGQRNCHGLDVALRKLVLVDGGCHFHAGGREAGVVLRHRQGDALFRDVREACGCAAGDSEARRLGNIDGSPWPEGGVGVLLRVILVNKLAKGVVVLEVAKEFLGHPSSGNLKSIGHLCFGDFGQQSIFD